MIQLLRFLQQLKMPRGVQIVPQFPFNDKWSMANDIVALIFNLQPD